jgi:hypothetical protein
MNVSCNHREQEYSMSEGDDSQVSFEKHKSFYIKDFENSGPGITQALLSSTRNKLALDDSDKKKA